MLHSSQEFVGYCFVRFLGLLAWLRLLELFSSQGCKNYSDDYCYFTATRIIKVVRAMWVIGLFRLYRYHISKGALG
jgi:hypothetical protein